MEILTNIWNALSTENAELVNLLLIPLAVVENIIIFYLFKVNVDKEKSYFIEITF